MSKKEINAVYSYIFDYVLKGLDVRTNIVLSNALMDIINKYNLFTG